MENPPPRAPKKVGFIDIGTNSIRLALVQIDPNGAYRTLSEQKETVRLGEGEFKNHMLQKDSMKRAIMVCKQFAEMARNNQAKEIVAVATSATREAKNQAQFIDALKKHAGLSVKTISGVEEARLIYLGISDGFDLKTNNALMIDIGGGSTELIVGNHEEYLHLDSMKLGAIRVSSMFFSPEDSGRVSDEKYQLIQRYVENTAIRSIQRVIPYHYDIAIGSSGTIQTLADVIYQHYHQRSYQKGDFVRTEELNAVIDMLRGMTNSEREALPGLVSKRADIIIGGAAILQTVLTSLEIKGFYVTDRTLRDGMLIDHLKRSEHAALFKSHSVRQRSVNQLAKKFRVDEVHSTHVQELALQLFDSTKKIKLHKLKKNYRELLAFASTLHDIGIFLSYSDHHKHSYYLIRNADLVGFNQNEIKIMAAIAFFHRKKFPKKSRTQLRELGKRDTEAVKVCATLIRIAEALDRSHQHVVSKAKFSRDELGNIYLDIYTNSDYQLELWRLNSHNPMFIKVFKQSFEVRIFDENGQPQPITMMT